MEIPNPNNSYEVFLNKYFGFNGEPELGPALYDIVKSEEIGWAVEILGVFPDGMENAAMIAVGPTFNICKHNDCVEEVRPNISIVMDRTNELVSQFKPGDYVFVEGALHLYTDGKSSEAAEPVEFLQRIHIHANSFRFSRSGTSEACKEAVENSGLW